MQNLSEQVSKEQINEPLQDKVEVLCTLLLDLCISRENDKKIKQNSEKEDATSYLIFSFDLSNSHHLTAIRDLLFYYPIQKATEVEKSSRQGSEADGAESSVVASAGISGNYQRLEPCHALSISVITRSMLEAAAILYATLEQNKAEKVRSYQRLFILLSLIDTTRHNHLSLLTAQNKKFIEENKDFLKKDGQSLITQGKYNDLTRKNMDENNFCTAIFGKQKRITKIVEDFLSTIPEIDPRAYSSLSGLSHSNPIKISRMIYTEPYQSMDEITRFNNGDSEILCDSLDIAIRCYVYIRKAALQHLNEQNALSLLEETAKTAFQKLHHSD